MFDNEIEDMVMDLKSIFKGEGAKPTSVFGGPQFANQYDRLHYCDTKDIYKNGVYVGTEYVVPNCPKPCDMVY